MDINTVKNITAATLLESTRSLALKWSNLLDGIISTREGDRFIVETFKAKSLGNIYFEIPIDKLLGKALIIKHKEGFTLKGIHLIEGTRISKIAYKKTPIISEETGKEIKVIESITFEIGAIPYEITKELFDSLIKRCFVRSKDVSKTVCVNYTQT